MDVSASPEPDAAVAPDRAGAPVPAPAGWTAELLRDFRAGTPAALAAVYRQHVDDVVGLLRRGFSFSSGGRNQRFLGLASPCDLQDAVQETFRRAFETRARDAYDGLRPYGPYLATIARNVVLSELRRQARRLPVADLSEAADDPRFIERLPAEDDDGGQPARGLHERQVRGLVERFVATLAPAERALLEARFVEGLSQRDAAAKLGLGRQQIRSRELRLRRALLGYLRAQGELGLVDGAVAGAALALALDVLRVLGEGIR